MICPSIVLHPPQLHAVMLCRGSNATERFTRMSVERHTMRRRAVDRCHLCHFLDNAEVVDTHLLGHHPAELVLLDIEDQVVAGLPVQFTQS